MSILDLSAILLTLSAVCLWGAASYPRPMRATSTTTRRTNNAADNLAALCQRCHLLDDAPEHRKHRAVTVRARRACGDLFEEHMIGSVVGSRDFVSCAGVTHCFKTSTTEH